MSYQGQANDDYYKGSKLFAQIQAQVAQTQFYGTTNIYNTPPPPTSPGWQSRNNRGKRNGNQPPIGNHGPPPLPKEENTMRPPPPSTTPPPLNMNEILHHQYQQHMQQYQQQNLYNATVTSAPPPPLDYAYSMPPGSSQGQSRILPSFPEFSAVANIITNSSTSSMARNNMGQHNGINTVDSQASRRYNKLRPREDDFFIDGDIQINKKGKRKPMSTRYGKTSNWDLDDAVKALSVEEEYNRLQKLPMIIIKFPDPEIKKKEIRLLSEYIENVHFQQPITPRYCFVQLKEDAHLETVCEEISRIPFGNGFLKAERKHAVHNHEQNKDAITPQEIDPYCLYIGNLPTTVSVKIVKDHFPSATRIDIGYAQRMKYTRYAFIRYGTVDLAIYAFKKTFNMLLDNRSLIVRFRRQKGNMGLPGEIKPQMPGESPSNSTIANIPPPQLQPKIHVRRDLELNVQDGKDDNDDLDKKKADEININSQERHVSSSTFGEDDENERDAEIKESILNISVRQMSDLAPTQNPDTLNDNFVESNALLEKVNDTDTLNENARTTPTVSAPNSEETINNSNMFGINTEGSNENYQAKEDDGLEDIDDYDEDEDEKPDTSILAENLNISSSNYFGSTTPVITNPETSATPLSKELETATLKTTETTVVTSKPPLPTDSNSPASTQSPSTTMNNVGAGSSSKPGTSAATLGNTTETPVRSEQGIPGPSKLLAPSSPVLTPSSVIVDDSGIIYYNESGCLGTHVKDELIDDEMDDDTLFNQCYMSADMTEVADENYGALSEEEEFSPRFSTALWKDQLRNRTNGGASSSTVSVTAQRGSPSGSVNSDSGISSGSKYSEHNKRSANLSEAENARLQYYQLLKDDTPSTSKNTAVPLMSIDTSAIKTEVETDPSPAKRPKLMPLMEVDVKPSIDENISKNTETK